MQEVWRHAAALESALRQWEQRLQRLNDEAADADSEAREQLHVLNGDHKIHSHGGKPHETMKASSNEERFKNAQSYWLQWQRMHVCSAA